MDNRAASGSSQSLKGKANGGSRSRRSRSAQASAAVVTLPNITNSGIPSAWESQGAGLSLEDLRQLIEPIRSVGHQLVGLEDVFEDTAGEKGLPPRIALSFQGMDRETFQTAVPLLVEMKVPFSLHVTTGLLDREYLDLPDSLASLIKARQELVILYRGRVSRAVCENPAEKQDCFRRLMIWLSQEVRPSERQALLRDLLVRNGVDVSELQESSSIGWEELRHLTGGHSSSRAKSSDISLGVMGHDLSEGYAASRERFLKDLRLAMARFEKELGMKPRHFATPLEAQLSAKVAPMNDIAALGLKTCLGPVQAIRLQTEEARPRKGRDDTIPRIIVDGRLSPEVAIRQGLYGHSLMGRSKAALIGRFPAIKPVADRLFPSTR